GEGARPPVRKAAAQHRKRARDVLLGDEPRERRVGDAPVVHARGREQHAQPPAAGGEDTLFGRAERKLPRKPRKQPARRDKGKDDGRRLYYILFDLKEQGFEDKKGLRKLQRRDLQKEGSAAPARREPRGKAGEPDAQRVEQQDEGEGIVGKRGAQREKDGKFGAARDIGQAQDGTALYPPVVQAARRKDCRRRASESHDERKD